MNSRSITFLVLLTVLALNVGCSSSKEEPKLPQYAHGEASVAADHIMITFQDTARAEANIGRSREEAKTLAEDVAKQAQAENADFGALAKKYSEGPAGPQGGTLGVFLPSEMNSEISDAVLKLKVGEVSDPVEGKSAFHIIIRREVRIDAAGNELVVSNVDSKQVSAKHILIMWKGSERSTVSRSKDEALKLVKEIQGRIKAGEKFEELAKKLSDGPSGKDGGDLGAFEHGTMAAPFSNAAFALDLKGVSDVVETTFGYHLIYRYK
jgi:parvulin-like peptidyl-prolyl isomerase